MASMSSWMRSVWLYCRMARPTRKIISKPCTHHTTVRCIDSGGLRRRLSFRKRASSISYLVHENVKDARGYRQGEEGEEEGEEPWRGVHGRVETLRSKMDVQLWQLLLRWKRIDFNCTYVNGANGPWEKKNKKKKKKKRRRKKDVPPPCGQCFHCRFDGLGWAAVWRKPHLQQILKLVDAESQLGHAGFEELPQAVLLHQAHKHAEGLLLGHLGAGQRRASRDRGWRKFSLDSSNSHFDPIKKCKATHLTGKWFKYQFY